MLIIKQYLPIPKQTDNEFWTVERIEHIRQLALTGKPSKIFPKWSSLRILDRVRFKNEDARISETPKARTFTKLAGIEMSAPLYLGDMSYGALSGNPNIIIARAADLTGTLAGTGEGGLHPEVAKSKRIFVQWASARFGVDFDVLMHGAGIVIKIGQGAKPGIGGHLPGSKVTEPISLTRRIPVGIDAISPAPHHDIYSIEDLGQRIEALKEATGKPVFVKVAATNYIPYIVSGIARMGADGVIIDGHGAGTGATPIVIRDNVGIPIELAVASADRVLREQGMRNNFHIIAAGRVADATDAAKLIALGADVVSVGTGALIAMGCVMVHKCHIGSCPTALTNKIDGSRMIDTDFGLKVLVNYIHGFSLELANILDNLGLSSIDELKGRRDLLVGKGLSRETLSVLGIEGEEEELPPKLGELWSRRRKVYLHELINKGDPVITSMGSTAPPDVEKPARIVDWLRSDGAQVTRPSIDPYREDIDTSFYLAGGRIYLSLPVIFDIIDAPEDERNALQWASLALSSAVFTDVTSRYYEDISISHDGKGVIKWSKNYEAGSYILLPSSEEAVEEVVELKGIPGFIIDEDLGNEDLEVVISEIDTKLKRMGIRKKFDLIAKSSRIRDSGDVFKLVALGADSVIMSYKVFEVALGEGSRSDLKSKAFNLISGFKKEIALLAGAAGVYSVQSTLTGNRELLRAINLNSYLLQKLRVKVAGSL
ncbi:glutamate synthase-related protein [Sulfurisphaera ohwakuensis]|uniref:Archaeal glutamate synthase [NADPH] n=1 Tax=Sulfurisphaera ohwakuensis TaxID=69656 RepID=A0A650CJC8_SULOH|nr:FMN-binding glutamate synthase family protein [Sulfurisphaera ohwakuensis]MBB5254952.1 glutamate synthase domain-containing protein 2 [Sulfurisphaera ohwakuensis]QGR17828.1 FMN-binding glutamate synthase family protein [Sulfurisphaera ohwakuensis]